MECAVPAPRLLALGAGGATGASGRPRDAARSSSPGRPSFLVMRARALENGKPVAGFPNHEPISALQTRHSLLPDHDPLSACMLWRCLSAALAYSVSSSTRLTTSRSNEISQCFLTKDALDSLVIWVALGPEPPLEA